MRHAKLLDRILSGRTDANIRFRELRRVLLQLGFEEPVRGRRKGMMHKYEIIIFWSEEDQAFVADVPELPGCMAHGDSPASALASCQDAIDLWLDTAREAGRPVPEPKGRRLA